MQVQSVNVSDIILPIGSIVMKKRYNVRQTQATVCNSRISMSSLLSEEKPSEESPEINPSGVGKNKGMNLKSRFF